MRSGERARSMAILLILLFVGTTHAFAAERRVVRIGVLSDGPHALDLEVQRMIEDEILALNAGEFDIRFPDEKRLSANWTLEGIRSVVDRALADSDVDLVLADGVFVSDEICRRTHLGKPVVAPFVVNPTAQQLPFKEGASGVHNLCYVNYPHDFRRDFRAFREIVPFTRMVFLANQLYMTAIPELAMHVTAQADSEGIDVTIVPVGTSADSALAAIPGDAQAVYLVPLTRFTDAEFARLSAGLIERRLPSFSLFGRIDVERGILAAIAPKTDYARLARRVAVDVQRILLGEDAGTFPVTLEAGEKPSINMATARAIDVWPSWAILTEAELVDETEPRSERILDLSRAIVEGLEVNLDAAASEREVAARSQDVGEARATLLPQVEVSTTGTWIDEDRAAASLGSQAERTWTGSASVSQVLFSEPAWANLGVQGHLLEATRDRDRQVRLDVAHDAAVGYLNVLRAKTFEGVQKDNLALTRSNLDRARVREFTGVASRAEVFRWESEIARSRQAVIDANAQRNLAEMELNRVLHHPLEEPFQTSEVTIEDAALPTRDERFASYYANPWNFRVFRGFMVEEGLATSPELRELDAQIAAQQRIRTSTALAFWLPTLSVQAGVTDLFAQGGAGNSSLAGSLPFSIPRADDLSWSVGVRASLPLFTSGSRSAKAERATQELERLRILRNSAAERVEQAIRSALHESGASFAGIQLARDAAEAARNNLDLVSDAYSRGVVSIIDLLDAQNAALVANLGAANAVYDFLIDLSNVQRAIGTFEYTLSASEREAWFERAEAYFAREREKRP